MRHDDISRSAAFRLGLAAAGALILAHGASAAQVQPTLPQGSMTPSAPSEPVAGIAPNAPAAMTPAQQAEAQIPSMVLRQDQVKALLAAIEDCESHGIPASDLRTTDIRRLLASNNDSDRRQGQVQLMQLALKYADRVRTGMYNPATFPDNWSIRAKSYDGALDLVQAIQGDTLDAWINSLPPPFEGYRGLRSALARYRAIAGQGGWEVVTTGPVLKAGMEDPRVPVLRRRLSAEDTAVSKSNSTRYDAELSAAVTRFQARNSLEQNGVLDAATVAAMNVPAEERIAHIEANLERWRWLPRYQAPKRVEVNIANQTLALYQNNEQTLTMRVVVGHPNRQTPMLMNAIQTVVFDPPWIVPASIASKELFPRAAAQPGYFASHGFVVSNGQIMQRPGPNSALGLIKFDLPNRFDVYLHDTPAKGLFARNDRALSHGCVRLSKPKDLAIALLADQQQWTPETIQTAMEANHTLRVPLTKPVPVSLLYWTAVALPDGQVKFARDVYGWDSGIVTGVAPATTAPLDPTLN